MRALIINDTRAGQHLGCVIVMHQLLQGCRHVGIRINASLKLNELQATRLEQELASVDVVIINGEGTMHHDSAGARAITRAGLAAARRGLPVALINTVWQENMEVNELLNHCSLITARESISAQAITQAGHPCLVVPDLTLSTAPQWLGTHAHESAQSSGKPVVLDDVRVDISLKLSRYAIAHGLAYLPMASRPSFKNVDGLIRWWRLGTASHWAKQLRMNQLGIMHQASLVVSGRFHGLCLAILAQKPFIAFASNTHKIEGLLKDAHLGAGGVLLADPPDDPALASDYITAAIDALQATMQDPMLQQQYAEACRQYCQQAQVRSREVFTAIAALGAKHKESA